jgi:transcriptional regulator with XRE-family HTH domain
VPAFKRASRQAQKGFGLRDARPSIQPAENRHFRAISPILENTLDKPSLLDILSAMTNRAHKLGQLLADARRRHKLTLRAVQDAVGISNPYLSQLETGKIRSPSPVVLHKLSDLYGLPYATVMQEAGYPLPKDVKETNPSSRFAARVGKTTPEEEDALIEYLMFLRSRRNLRENQ